METRWHPWAKGQSMPGSYIWALPMRQLKCLAMIQSKESVWTKIFLAVGNKESKWSRSLTLISVWQHEWEWQKHSRTLLELFPLQFDTIKITWLITKETHTLSCFSSVSKLLSHGIATKRRGYFPGKHSGGKKIEYNLCSFPVCSSWNLFMKCDGRIWESCCSFIAVKSRTWRMR